MSNRIITRHGDTVPVAEDLEHYEFGFKNPHSLFIKNSSGVILRSDSFRETLTNSDNIDNISEEGIYNIDGAAGTFPFVSGDSYSGRCLLKVEKVGFSDGADKRIYYSDTLTVALTTDIVETYQRKRQATDAQIICGDWKKIANTDDIPTTINSLDTLLNQTFSSTATLGAQVFKDNYSGLRTAYYRAQSTPYGQYFSSNTLTLQLLRIGKIVNCTIASVLNLSGVPVVAEHFVAINEIIPPEGFKPNTRVIIPCCEVTNNVIYSGDAAHFWIPSNADGSSVYAGVMTFHSGQLERHGSTSWITDDDFPENYSQTIDLGDLSSSISEASVMNYLQSNSI